MARSGGAGRADCNEKSSLVSYCRFGISFPQRVAQVKQFAVK
jgi:hypothetical protein